MIQFVRPWLLIGVLGALVPLVIHLAGRRKAPRVQFTALRFVLSRDPARARAARLRERLLLGLRMVIAALIAVALAKPMVPSLTPQATAVAGSAPVALVIVRGTAGLDAVELGRRGRVERVELDGERHLSAELPVAGLEQGDYVYLRVLQSDGALAWSSPWFVE